MPYNADNPTASRYTDSEILDGVRRGFKLGLSRKHLWQSRHADAELPSVEALITHFGSWAHAVEAAGLVAGVGPGHGQGSSGQGGGYLNSFGKIVQMRKPIASGHLWTVENPDGAVIYRDFKYPELNWLKKNKVLPVAKTGCAIVRVDYLCPA